MASVRSFDGSADFITLGIGACDIHDYNDNITIVAVSRYGSSGWNSIITACAGGTTTGDIRWSLEHSSGGLSYNGEDGDNILTGAPLNAIGVDEWWITAVKRPAGQTQDVEFWGRDLTNNGSWVNSNPGSNVTASGLSNPDRILIGRWGYTDDMNGRIAFVAVYDRVLTDAEVQSIAGVQDALDLSPVGAWTFDQDSTATDVIDLTGNGANQTARTGTSVVEETVPNFDMSHYLFPVVTAILDNFNRASLGSNWSALALANGQLVIDGSIRIHGGADSYTGSYWNVDTFGPDVEVYATYVGANGDVSSNYFGLWARLQDGADATPDAYLVTANNNTLSLIKKIGGNDTTLGTYAWNPDNGDKFGISCVGDIISAYTDEGAGWIERIRVKDSSISAAGRIALDIYDPNVDNIYLDNFGGGTIAELELDQIRPDADNVTTGWTTTPLYSKINDSSDATVIQATAV